MRCPACKEIGKDKVIDSRLTEGGAAIRRRRLCQDCGRRFTTKERTEQEVRLSVIKRDSARVPYRRDKVIAGIRHACYKLPIDDGQIDRVVDEIEGDIFRDHDREVTSEQIGLYAARRLRDLNPVAYVRFMSVYRTFADVAEFAEEIQNVQLHAASTSPDQQSLFNE